MTVTELRELLQCLENDGHGELDVVFAYNYGDHWRTHVAPTITDAEEGTVMYSSYHSMDKIVDDEEDEYTNESRKVIVLK